MEGLGGKDSKGGEVRKGVATGEEQGRMSRYEGRWVRRAGRVVDRVE